MQFYKERDFGELFSDTFNFIKLYGRNYFKNYLLLNGMIIILLLIVFYFGFGEFFQQIFSSNLEGQQFYFEQYFQENQGVLVGSFILLFAVFMILSLVSYSYPVLYLKRVSETGASEVSTNEMIDDIKSKLGKFFIFFLGTLFIVSPIIALAMFISVLLMFVVIGFFLLLFLIPAMMNIINFSLYHYYHEGVGFFNALGYGIRAQLSKNFWKYWGSATILYVIIQIITSVITSIPMIIIFAGGFVNPTAMDESSLMMIITTIVYGLSFIISFILSNMMYINAGLMYYDARKDLHRDMQFSEIDNIGTGEV